MNANGGKRWARAAVCAAALVTPLAVSGCQSSATASGTLGAAGGAGTQSTTSSAATGSTSAGSSSGAGGGDSGSSSTPSPSTATSSSPALNATAGTSLTVSDGSSKILMNGRAVDFGTEVHDPSWSADGKQVLFIDGDGNLAVADADGTGRTVLAKNPGGQKWSHPTWWQVAADSRDGLPARAAYYFASTTNGVTTLWELTSAPDTKLRKLDLAGPAGANPVVIPQTGNLWPSASGKLGGAVYENDHGSGSDLYLRDDNLRSQTSLAIRNGSEPDYVVTGTSAGAGWVTEVVFVRKTGGHRHVFEQTMGSEGGAAAATDLTPNATTDCTEPALSPDGSKVAFSTSSGVEIASVTTPGTTVKVTNSPGFPAFRAGS